jgi:hypothetical protein
MHWVEKEWPYNPLSEQRITNNKKRPLNIDPDYDTENPL